MRLIVVDPAVAVKVPPQVLVALGVLATCTPVGKVSLTARPVRITVLPVGLVMVRVRVEVPPTAMLLGEKALVIVGGISTDKVAEAVPPVPPFVELTLPVVLARAPVVVAATLTLMAQLVLTPTVPPLRLIAGSPGFGAKVPPQVLVAFGVAATCIPVGKASLTATPLCATVLAAGLVMVMVRVEVPFAGMLAGANALVMVGADTTVKVAEAVVLVTPLLEVTVLVVLFLLPAVLAVTSTLTAQLLLTGMDPPLRLIEPAPAFAVKVPPQVLPVFGMAATTTPEGKVSLTATPASARGLAAGLVMVKVSVEVPPARMVAGANPLVMVGAASTLRVAEPVLPVPPSPALTLPVVLT